MPQPLDDVSKSKKRKVRLGIIHDITLIPQDLLYAADDDDYYDSNNTSNNNRTVLRITPLPWKPNLKLEICSCKEKLEKARKRRKLYKNEIKTNRTGVQNGKPLRYPFSFDKTILITKIFKTFQIKYDGILTSTERSLLSSFKHKYIYYAIDDILYLCDSKTPKQEKLLSLLYTITMYLHNNFSVNFFDIWIDTIYINDIPNTNRFLISKDQNLKKTTYITLKIYYTIKPPVKKPEPLW